MRKVVIEEAVNGYIVRFTKYFGDDIIESGVTVYHTIAEIQTEVEDYFSKDSSGAGYKD